MSSRIINIGLLKANEVEIGSTIGIGRNLHITVYSSLNCNQGFGIETSDGSIYNSPVGRVWDSDIIDSNHVYKADNRSI